MIEYLTGGYMRYKYKTHNTCAKEIEFDLNDDIVSNVKFLGGGCPGNLQAIPKLVDGMRVNEIEEKLADIKCGFKNTSCAAELAKGVREAFNSLNQK